MTRSRQTLRRWHVTCALVALLVSLPAVPPLAQDAPPTPLMLISKDGRRPVPTIVNNGREYIALDDLAPLFQVTVREDSLAGGVTVSYRGRTIVASADQPMASVDGRIVSLPFPIARSGRRWLVPVDFLPRALGPIYDQRIDLRRAARLVLVGDLRVPRVAARIELPGPPTRATLVITPASGTTVSPENGRLLIRVEADALDAFNPPSSLGLIESIRVGDQPNVILVTLSRQAALPRATVTTVENTTRVAIEVAAADLRAPAPDPRAPGGDPRTTSPESRAPTTDPRVPPELTLGRPEALQTIVIDPGHGGDEVGVRGAGGLEEKQLTLDVARRLRGLVESRLGIRVILTRDDDRAVGIDERAAAANNGKADLLVSLHANGALSGTPAGAEVLYDRLDREGEAARLMAAAGSVSLPVVGGGTRTIDIVPWDLAQAPHVEASAMFAGMIQEELRQRVPMGPRPLQQTPLRLLTAANMPAALVEMAYLTNAKQEKAAGGDEFKNAVAQALFTAIVRFRGYLEEAAAP